VQRAKMSCVSTSFLASVWACQQKPHLMRPLVPKRLLHIGKHARPAAASPCCSPRSSTQELLLARARDPFCSIAPRRPCRPRGPSSCQSPAVRRSKWISSSKRGRNVQRTQHAARVLDDLPKEHHPRCPSIDLSPCKKAPAAPPRPCLSSRLAHERAASPSCPLLAPRSRESRPRCLCPQLAPRSRECRLVHARVSLQWASARSTRFCLAPTQRTSPDACQPSMVLSAWFPRKASLAFPRPSRVQGSKQALHPQCFSRRQAPSGVQGSKQASAKLRSRGETLLEPISSGLN